MNLTGVASAALGEMTNKRLQALYQKDFIAWQSDVLGVRTYGKMEHILNDALFGEINRTAIKSSNGTSKSFSVASAVAWVASAFDIGETVSIITAPTLTQIDRVIFAYLKSFKNMASERGFELPGKINEQLEWKVPGPQGSIALAFGRKPATGTEVSSFQGVRSQFGKTWVWFDEAGGLSKNMYTAAEAVLTGADARLVAIGNPDDAGTEWERIFKDKKYDGEFNRHTISSFDLPTFTGEVVYPDDEKMQAQMLLSLTQVSWVEHKKRIWGEHDARYRSKVLGEFPADGGNGFFSQAVINSAIDTNIEEDQTLPLIAGADIARWGADESVIAANRGGRIRVADSWGKCDLVDSARRIHAYAQREGATEVRIDSTGVGGGVYDMLDRLDEFADKTYTLIGWDNGKASPDITQWSNMRSYSHDSLRSQMAEGGIDLDFEDEELQDQLQIITYKFTNRGGIQITPKDDLKTEMGGSPDRLDAVIMAGTDMSPWTGNPYNRMPVGAVISQERSEVAQIDHFQDMIRGPGMPMYW